jgi:triosephosphate isomerase
MIIAANFKTNHTRVSTVNYIMTLNSFINDNNITENVIVFPPATALDGFESPYLNIGAQNAYPVDSGAYTGEIGVDQLEEFGLKTILIGHSERRHILNESQEEIAHKFNFFKSKGYKIVYCVGEPERVYNQGFGETLKYINSQFEGIDTEYENLVIAYEPVWAIGTGKVAKPEDISKVHDQIKNISTKPIIYGGSVSIANSKEILSINNVDGVLVGSASLDIGDFCEIVRNAKETVK